MWGWLSSWIDTSAPDSDDSSLGSVDQWGWCELAAPPRHKVDADVASLWIVAVLGSLLADPNCAASLELATSRLNNATGPSSNPHLAVLYWRCVMRPRLSRVWNLQAREPPFA